jgi:hypothetical protein
MRCFEHINRIGDRIRTFKRRKKDDSEELGPKKLKRQWKNDVVRGKK